MKRTERTIVIVLTLLLLLMAGAQFTNFSSANFFPNPGPDLPRIYIRSNGNVEPATAPIQRTGNTYKLTGDIVLNTVEIQSDNIVLDGAGHTIQGNRSWVGYDAGNNGVVLTGRKGVKITGLNFKGCYASVRVIGSSNISIVGNSFTSSNNMGVVIQDSTFVLIEENTFTELRTDLDVPAIKVNGSNNVIRSNTLTGSTYGIKIVGSSNVISDNRIEALLPLILDRADSNIIARNNITGPPSSAHLPGQNYKGNEGVALFADCSNNLIIGNNITGFINQAIRFVFNCENNTVYDNYMADNQFAVVIQEGAINNRFYCNTFAADSCNVSIYEVQSNFWDNGTIGNYWGDYAGADANGDGIGDVPYKLKGFNWDNEVGGFVSAPAGQDNYPLMAPYELSTGGLTSTSPSQEPASEPFPTTLVAAASIVSAVVVTSVLLLYLKKRNH
jgi:parallel beta-helix repeat protein